jgi:hypothetical protein
MYRYQVYVKVKGSMVKTIIFADNDIHARLLAQYQYGMNNDRVKSMQDQVKRTQQAIKAEKARQKIKAGQDQLKKSYLTSTTLE